MTYTDSPSQPGHQDLPPMGPQPPRKKRHRVRNWVVFPAIGVISLITAAGIAGAATSSGTRAAATPPAPAAPAATAPADTTPAAEPPPEPAGPMQLTADDSATITQDGQDAATITITSVTVTTSPADLQYGSRPAHGYYVTARVTVTADPAFTGGLDASAGDFYELTRGQHYDEGNGNSYSALSDSQSDSELSFTNLAAGETARGLLVFDVPSAHGQVVYAPNYDGQPLAEWEY